MKQNRQPDFRAFPILDEVPPGHFPFLVGDHRFEPYLHADDWVVVDTTDRDSTVGELHLVLSSRGPRLWQVVAMKGELVGRRGGERGYMLCPLQHVQSLPAGERHEMPINLSDGPYTAEDLRQDILGRVVGLIDPRARMERQRLEAQRANEEWERAQRRGPEIEGGAA